MNTRRPASHHRDERLSDAAILAALLGVYFINHLLRTPCYKPVENRRHNAGSQDRRSRSATDFRPISITPVLSRLLEKFVVRKFIYPALLQQYPSLDFSNQLAFRPSGSTTAVIVAMLHTVRSMLADNNYVHVFSFDFFSKAFDTVRHALLTSKLAQLELPDSMYNWAVDLDYHAHCTKLAEAISEIAIIHAQRHSRIGARTSILHCHCVRSVHCPRPKPASQPNCVVSEHFGR